MASQMYETKLSSLLLQPWKCVEERRLDLADNFQMPF